MEISKEDLDRAVDDGLITSRQALELWRALELRHPPALPSSHTDAEDRAAASTKPRFDFVHVAYYFGALIVIGAMGWFMTLGWERLGGGGISAIAFAYAVCFVLVGRALWNKPDLRIPGGLLVTMAVAMTPLGVYGLERAFGWWPDSDPGKYQGFHEWINGGWFAMEVATICAGALALYFFRFPFITATIAFTLWYMSMDLAPLLFGLASWDHQAEVSAVVGLGILVVGYVVDRRTREDFAFWLYLFGLLAFMGGLSAIEGGTEATKVIYLLVSLALMVISIAFDRRTFMVFGALGVTGYLGHLAHHVFENSMLFPFALSLIGVAIIALGVHYHRNRGRYERALIASVPAGVKKFLPPERAR